MPEDTPAPVPEDVRMRGFARRVTVAVAIERLERLTSTLPAETVPLSAAAGRVLATEVVSAVDVPGFRRAMMDGYAVRAADTLGAAAYNPLPLEVVGEVLPGAFAATEVAAGQCLRIMTGAPLPSGADAVLPAEKVQPDGDRVLAMEPVPPQKHVGEIGEDLRVGEVVLPAGRRLRPQDVGVLSSVGTAEVTVVRTPRVRLLITGDELLPPGAEPSGCQIADANSPMLEALVRRDGGQPFSPGIVPDRREQIRAALLEDADVVLVSGGSSVGQEDHAPTLLAELGEVVVHGVAMRPSSPAGFGCIGPKLVFLLPGNPVSCLCAYDVFAGRAIRVLAGRTADWPYPRKRLPLKRKLVSTVGRVDYARVRIEDGAVEPLAISGASVLSSTTRATGFVMIPHDSEGYPAGREVEVWFYDLP